MNPPKFTLRDLKFSVDEAMFQRAEELVKKGKIQKIKEDSKGYDAIVQGTSPYHVSISAKNVDVGYCDCYMGQNDELCKHMIALGLAVLQASGKAEEDSQENYSPTDLKEAKRLVSAAMRKIKSYNGPSRVWFDYQHKLEIGSAEITEALQNLPANRENATYLWSLVMKLSHKLAYDGVDDSNGIVGGCIDSIVHQLEDYGKKDPSLKPLLQKFTQEETGFGFEEDLAKKIAF